MTKKAKLLLLFGIATLAVSWTATAAEVVGIAAFNLAWAGTDQDYEKHFALCNQPTVAWCDARAKGNSPTPSETRRAQACQAEIDAAAGGAAPALQIAPCNAYAYGKGQQAATASNEYRKKLDGLTRTVDRLVRNERVAVFAFQEVKSEAVIRQILDRYSADYDVCVAAHSSFQTVGFAWARRVSSKPGQCTTRRALAIKESPWNAASLRSLRPGLALRLEIDGEPITFLNIHLKSSCANLLAGGPFPGHLLTDPDANCQMLNRQLPHLEDWVDEVSVASPRFVLIGDFNRRIDEEAQADVRPDQVRATGVLPSQPNPKGPRGAVASKYLWQEIADNTPPSSEMFQVPLTAVKPKCKGFTGLDHIVVSRAVFDLQIAGQLGSMKSEVSTQRGQRIRTSDHCPRVASLAL